LLDFTIHFVLALLTRFVSLYLLPARSFVQIIEKCELRPKYFVADLTAGEEVEAGKLN